MVPSTPSSGATITNSKVRGVQSAPRQSSVSNGRDLSLSEGMSMLKLDEENVFDPKNGYRQTLDTSKDLPIPAKHHKRSFSASMRNIGVGSSDNALVLFQGFENSLVAPKTPSQIPVFRKPEHKSEGLIAAPETPCRIPKPSPIKSQFLSKDSNIPGFTAWDVDARLGSIESMYADLQEKIKSTTTDRSEMEEEVGVYKLKSEFSIHFVVENLYALALRLYLLVPNISESVTNWVR